LPFDLETTHMDGLAFLLNPLYEIIVSDPALIITYLYMSQSSVFLSQPHQL